MNYRGLREVAKNQRKTIRIVRGSGNVFADLGFAQPEEEFIKAKLASLVRKAIKRKHLSKIRAGAVMGVDPPNVSALMNGRLSNSSSERLMGLLTALGQDVRITVTSKPVGRELGRIQVVCTVR